MANLNVSTWYIDSAQWTAVGAWIQNHPYTCGNLIRQLSTPAVNSERVFVCGTAGTTNNTGEPAWTLTRYGATTDGTAIWYECTGNPAVNGDLANALTWAQQHASNTTITAGLIIYDSITASLQICTTGGTISSSVPSFSATAGTVTSDGATVKWTSLGAASGFQYWKAPHARLANAFASTWGASGNNFFVGSDHAETQAATMTNTVPGAAGTIVSIYCVDHTTALPPTSANLKTTATITTTGAFAMTALSVGSNGQAYCYGITFSCGTGSTAENMTLGGVMTLEACTLALATTGAATIAYNVVAAITLINTVLSFSNATQNVQGGGILRWQNTASAVAGTAPTALFEFETGGTIICEGVDLSAITGSLCNWNSSNIRQTRATFIDCKLASGVALSSNTVPGAQAQIISSSNSAVTYTDQHQAYQALLTTSTNVVRTGGAVKNGTPVSWNIVTVANATFNAPYVGPSLWAYNPNTGANVNVNVYGVWFGSALPNTDQIWHDVQFYGSASSPLASLGKGTKANGLAVGSAWTADTSAWDSEAAAWIANHAYTAGAIIAGSSVGNSGRIFICTQSGTSTNGAAPAAFASAVDGGSVTDAGAKWQAGWRFKMTVALTSPQPQLAGYLYSYVKAAFASSTFYIDPQIALS